MPNAPAPLGLPARQPSLVPAAVRQLDPRGGGRLALFDADGTLFRDDVADDFTRWLMDTGRAPQGELWDEYTQVYREDHAAGCRFLLRLYAGLPLRELQRLNRTWWTEHANRVWVVEALEAVYWLAEHDYEVWIVTGSPTDVMTPLPDVLPLSRVVGMDFELDADGVITGLVEGISCADEGKADKVLALAGGRPVAFAAGNGSLDEAMMALAGSHAWGVYPNEAFAQACARRGWPILARPADFVEEAKLA